MTQKTREKAFGDLFDSKPRKTKAQKEQVYQKHEEALARFFPDRWKEAWKRNPKE